MLAKLRKSLVGNIKEWFWKQRFAFGLRNTRLQEWWAVVQEEGAIMDPKSWWKMFLGAIHATVFTPVKSAEFRKRLRICAKCPIKEPGYWRCRPYTGSTLGCGCYIPFIAKGLHSCWAYDRHPAYGWGPQTGKNERNTS